MTYCRIENANVSLRRKRSSESEHFLRNKICKDFWRICSSIRFFLGDPMVTGN